MYAQRKPIENTHIVRERDQERFRELLAVLSLSVPIGLFLLLFTWQNIEVIRLGRQITRLQSHARQLRDSNKNLRLEVERLTSLDAVERKALSLGLRPADSAELVRVIDPSTGAAEDRIQSSRSKAKGE